MATNPAEGASQYIQEYMAAVDRTVALGLEAPMRVVVCKDCVDMNRVRPVLLDYFDRYTPQDLMGQTLATHCALLPLLTEKTGIPFNLTVGWMTREDETFFQHDEETIRRFMRETRRLSARRLAVSSVADLASIRNKRHHLCHECWLGE